MLKDKVLHLRRDGGCWETGWGRLRRPGGGYTQTSEGVGGVDVGMGRLRRPVGGLAIQNRGYTIPILGIILLAFLLSACSGPFSSSSPAPTSTKTTSSGLPAFPTTALALRTPAFGTSGQVAPTVKVLASADPSLIVQFSLAPASIKTLFPDATGLVTVIQGNPQTNDFDTLIVDVQKMPPNVKFTVFLTELSAKPFGHAEYVGDVITRGDGSGESIFHLITFVAFAADARNSTVTSADQSGDASGIQLEHVGMWFDGVSFARKVLNNPNIPGTPFDGGGGALHAGPQAMTDGQTLSVI
ncbi:MAG TPA: hypothetical protein VNW73_04615 [Ktedonobacteraceae bacterium]|jgi:hypothetical protein|nr:hypothetical protein [Ktedonobacteraceae bacterium]